MIATDVIRHKRDGLELEPAAIEAFLAAYTDGSLPDYQMSALAMAIFFRGMTPKELAAWTRAMLHSGDVLDFSALSGRKVDKHSTGGVGDKISLPLAPLVAACGVKVPMISGRGLGHTGGTLDKLESIPGFQVRLDTQTFRHLVDTLGCGLIGQTDRLAPTDKKLYSLRDVTSTVESIPLISSSIMSKKLAEGIDALVLDVKFGSGAFMKTQDNARILAQTMVGIGKSFGKQVTALLTSMEQPLGAAIGNALEVFESLDILQGKGPADVKELTLALGAEMLIMGHVATTVEDARKQLQRAIDSGAGMQKFEQIVAAQGGDAKALTDRSRMSQAHTKIDVFAPHAGVITRIQTDEVGRAAMMLGAGRQTVSDVIDPAVGVMLHQSLGSLVDPHVPLATFYVNDESQLMAAKARFLKAYTIEEKGTVVVPQLVAERITTEDLG